MSGIAAQRTTAPSATYAGIGISTAANHTQTALLPAANAPILDPQLMMTILTAKQRDATLASQSADIRANQREREETAKALQVALEAARKAREESSFFGDICDVLGKIGQVAALVGAVASIAVTGGASLPAVLALTSVGLSALATANKELKLIDGDIGGALNTGLAIASAAAGLGAAGAGIIHLGAAAGQTAANSLSAANQLTQTAAEGSRVAAYVGQTAQLASAASTATSAGFAIASKVATHAAEMHIIDAEEVRATTAKLLRQQAQIAKDARDIAASYQRAIDTMLSTMGESQRTQHALASAIRG
jgi:hypothetical protein